MHKNMLNYVRRYDEYYTRYEHVKNIFERYIHIEELKDKIIYCPCDSDESNFVIYLKEHKDDIQYKELIYTSDDFNTHIDLFEQCDIIITNPPFSKIIKEFIPILNKVNKKFFILGSMISIYTYSLRLKSNVKFVRVTSEDYFDFIMPEDSNLPNYPLYIYISNMNINNYYKEPKFDKEEKNMVHAIRNSDGKKFKHYSRINNIPLDEYDEIFVPATVLLEHNIKYFDIIELGDKTKYTFEDGKIRYTRLIVKRKRSMTMNDKL